MPDDPRKLLKQQLAKRKAAASASIPVKKVKETIEKGEDSATPEVIFKMPLATDTSKEIDQEMELFESLVKKAKVEEIKEVVIAPKSEEDLQEYGHLHRLYEEEEATKKFKLKFDKLKKMREAIKRKL